MREAIPKSNVYIKQSNIRGAGRGVFAARDIRKGEHIEVCPVIEISAHDMANLNESILVTYFFFHGKGKNSVFLALGFGSLYNHSFEPNATYIISPMKKTITFTAVDDIKKDSEITFNYKSQDAKGYPLWFEKTT